MQTPPRLRLSLEQTPSNNYQQRTNKFESDKLTLEADRLKNNREMSDVKDKEKELEETEVPKDDKNKNNKPSYHVVGVFKQVLILLWKNWIVFRRHKLAIFVEIFATYIFVLILFLLRYFIDSTQYKDQTLSTYNVLSLVNDSSGRSVLYYYPNNAFLQTVVQDAVNLINAQKSAFNPTVTLSTTSDASSLTVSQQSNMFALVSFPDSYTSASFPNNVEYTIYTQEYDLYRYNINEIFITIANFLYNNAPQYYCTLSTYYKLYYSMFNPLQHAIDLIIINRLGGSTPTTAKISQFDCTAYDNDIFHGTFSFFVIILVALSFMFTMLINLKNIIVEKETKMKEYLKIVGIKWYSIWIAWIIRSLIPYFFLSLILSFLSVIQLPPRESSSKLTYKAIFYSTQYMISLSVYMVYAFQTTLFTLLLGQIFSNSFVAKTVGVILWVFSVINIFAYVPGGARYLFCFMPNWGLLFSFQVINQFERSSIGLDYPNMYNNLYNDAQILGVVLLVQILWSFAYLPLAWYIEHVFPGEYGAPLPFYFPFMPSYWFGDCNKNKTQDVELDDRFVAEEKVGFEPDPADLECTISLEKLTKKFTRNFKEKTVVDNVTLKFYRNQVTGLLGHNGAGKTTTTFMLCGIYSPTSGDAVVLGHSIKKQMEKVRSSIGFCPQHSILYDDLTVAEHIRMIAMIKGYPLSKIKDEIKEITSYVGLHSHLKKKSKQLSGGMKRRLSVAMALTGGSQIIILDEPTSGLDPYNRRTLWELVRKFKNDKTIILTTHFMEEADALSDRIAIMNHGQVKCCGSPIFLKNTFGSGYRLVLSKKPDLFNEQVFKSMLDSMVKGYVIESNIAAEVCVNIPFSESPRLAQLLNTIESNKQTYGIEGYGISSPTVEEVFIKVGSIDANKEQTPIENAIMDTRSKSFVSDGAVGLSVSSEAEAENKEEGRKKSPKPLKNKVEPNNLNEIEKGNKDTETNESLLADAFSTEFSKNRNISLWFEQLWGMWLKRFRIFYRRYLLAGFILLLPIAMELVISGITSSGTNYVDSSSSAKSKVGVYNLKITNYSTQTLPYYISGTSSATLQTFLTSNVYTSSNRPGVTLSQVTGTTDVNNYVLRVRKSNQKYLYSDYFVGMSLDATSSTAFTAEVFYSTVVFHSAGAIINEIDNLLLQYMKSSTAYSITTYNAPLPKASTGSASSSTFLDVLPCLDIMPLSLLNFLNSILIGFIIGILTMHISREKINGSKQLQILSGTNYSSYWLANYLFDWPIAFFNLCSIVIVIVIMSAIRNDSTNELWAIGSNSKAGYLFFFLWVSSFSWLNYAYVWSFFFKSDIVSFIVLAILMGMMAFFDVIITFIQILFVSYSGKSTGPSMFISAIRYIIAIFFPNVTVKRAIYDLKVQGNTFCIDAANLALANNLTYTSYPMDLSEPGIGGMLIIAFVQFLVSLVVLFLIEARLCSRCSCAKCKKHIPIPNQQLEEDVEIEQERIKNANIKELTTHEPLVVRDLVRQFRKGGKKFLAVSSISFGISPNECFGFLGSNGAGKTTTFKILTGEIKPSQGNAYVNGYNITTKMQKARRNMAFCPQFDLLPEYLTVRDTLKLFARIRGLKVRTINTVVNSLMEIFKITEFQDKFVQNLSGGNQRKVSSAISFIGRPKLVFLDEPTTGMDPAARRYLWTVIKKARDSGMTIVLTTHSMEECEALSSKLGIMVNGQFKCFGSVQHLKDKFGKGYTLILKCTVNTTPEGVNKVEEFVKQKVKFSSLKDKQQGTLFYQIEFDRQKVNERDIQSIAELFSLVESNKDALSLETYSLSQTSLEEVFLSLTREQLNQEQQDSLAESDAKKESKKDKKKNKKKEEEPKEEEMRHDNEGNQKPEEMRRSYSSHKQDSTERF